MSKQHKITPGGGFGRECKISYIFFGGVEGVHRRIQDFVGGGRPPPLDPRLTIVLP